MDNDEIGKCKFVLVALNAKSAIVRHMRKKLGHYARECRSARGIDGTCSEANRNGVSRINGRRHNITGAGQDVAIADKRLSGPIAVANLNAQEDHLDPPGVVLPLNRSGNQSTSHNEADRARPGRVSQTSESGCPK